MNKQEFNEKWKDHIENCSYGMAISDPDVIDYVDSVLEDNKDSNFTIIQIKEKYDSILVLIIGLPKTLRDNMAETIHLILEEKSNKEYEI